MLCRGELSHFDTDFRQDTLRSVFTDTSDGIDALSRLLPVHPLRTGKLTGRFEQRFSALSYPWFVSSLPLRFVGGRKPPSNFLAHPSDGCIQTFDLLQMLSQHEPMVDRHLSRQSRFQGLLAGANSSYGKSS